MGKSSRGTPKHLYPFSVRATKGCPLEARVREHQVSGVGMTQILRRELGLIDDLMRHLDKTLVAESVSWPRFNHYIDVLSKSTMHFAYKENMVRDIATLIVKLDGGDVVTVESDLKQYGYLNVALMLYRARNAYVDFWRTKNEEYNPSKRAKNESNNNRNV
jgi:hypothetical protein